MREIYLDKPTGFRVKKLPVIIRDKRGVMFYTTEPLSKPVKFFNLPAGIKLFVESGSFEPLPQLHKFRMRKLPKRRERNYPVPTNFDFVVEPCPHKAMIDWAKKKIVIDPEMMEKPVPFSYYLLFHEIGHHLYGTEAFADDYAANQLLKRGFNPSQIMRAPVATLSNKQAARKEKIIDKFTLK